MDIKTINKIISLEERFTVIIGDYLLIISRYWRDINRLPTYEISVGTPTKPRPFRNLMIMVNPNWVSIDYSRHADETTDACCFVPDLTPWDAEKDAEKVKEYILTFKESLRQEYCPA